NLDFLEFLLRCLYTARDEHRGRNGQGHGTDIKTPWIGRFHLLLPLLNVLDGLNVTLAALGGWNWMGGKRALDIQRHVECKEEWPFASAFRTLRFGTFVAFGNSDF